MEGLCTGDTDCRCSEPAKEGLSLRYGRSRKILGSNTNATPIPRERELACLIREWLDSLAGTTATETALEPKFISQIMCHVLGYTPYPAPAGVKATIYSKPSSKITGIKRTPDAALGEFADSDVHFVAAVELKSPGTDLDLPQPSYEYANPRRAGLLLRQEYPWNAMGRRFGHAAPFASIPWSPRTNMKKSISMIASTRTAFLRESSGG